LQSFLQRAGGFLPLSPDFVQIGDKIIGSSQLGAAGEPGQERFVVFTVREDMIIDMQGCASRREAERFANRG
jgi:hypothetical protein